MKIANWSSMLPGILEQAICTIPDTKAPMLSLQTTKEISWIGQRCLLSDMNIIFHSEINTKIMKTCNNCSTENHIAAEKCVQCNMQDNFTYQEVPMEAPQIKEKIVHCKNCASDNPGNGDKCIQCNFPIQRTTRSTLVSQIPLKANLNIS